MNEIIFEIREDESEGGFVARALGHSIVIRVDTWEDLRIYVRDAERLTTAIEPGPVNGSRFNHWPVVGL